MVNIRLVATGLELLKGRRNTTMHHLEQLVIWLWLKEWQQQRRVSEHDFVLWDFTGSIHLWALQICVWFSFTQKCLRNDAKIASSLLGRLQRMNTQLLFISKGNYMCTMYSVSFTESSFLMVCTFWFFIFPIYNVSYIMSTEKLQQMNLRVVWCQALLVHQSSQIRNLDAGSQGPLKWCEVKLSFSPSALWYPAERWFISEDNL